MIPVGRPWAARLARSPRQQAGAGRRGARRRGARACPQAARPAGRTDTAPSGLEPRPLWVAPSVLGHPLGQRSRPGLCWVSGSRDRGSGRPALSSGPPRCGAPGGLGQGQGRRGEATPARAPPAEPPPPLLAPAPRHLRGALGRPWPPGEVPSRRPFWVLQRAHSWRRGEIGRGPWLPSVAGPEAPGAWCTCPHGATRGLASARSVRVSCAPRRAGPGRSGV